MILMSKPPETRSRREPWGSDVAIGGFAFFTVEVHHLARFTQPSLWLCVCPAGPGPSLYPNEELHARCYDVVTVKRRKPRTVRLACLDSSRPGSRALGSMSRGAAFLVAHWRRCLPREPSSHCSVWRVDVSDVASCLSPSHSASYDIQYGKKMSQGTIVQTG